VGGKKVILGTYSLGTWWQHTNGLTGELGKAFSVDLIETTELLLG